MVRGQDPVLPRCQLLHEHEIQPRTEAFAMIVKAF